MLTTNNLEQIKQKGISEDVIHNQIEHFKTGFPFARLNKAATIGDGLLSINAASEKAYISLFEKEAKEGMDITKFVPASGAATRMFKMLFEFLETEEKAELATKEPYQTFFAELNNFAFANELSALSAESDKAEIIRHILEPRGMNYGNLPKGLLKFHKDESFSYTPLEEHLKETAGYAVNKQSAGTIHFTVSPEHQALFETLVSQVKDKFEKKYGITLKVSFSTQKPSTDTLAVTPDNEPFINSDDSLLFRPGGHGALIENLNDLTQELIFIKNIDNVVPEHLQKETIQYKKLLAGVLLEKRNKVFEILKQLKSAANADVINEAQSFLKNELQIDADLSTLSQEEQVQFLTEKLNRPIRVCGMVKNEGEPGGGPFWVEQNDGTCSLQIVEGAQIDPNNAAQQAILKDSTHFNPVDLVCYVKNYKGEKFDLSEFVDAETGFISEKSKNGKTLKALELPGLWNGAMAHWLTFFVEVPVSTFNPVKTVMDLLRPQHQPE